MRFAKVTSFFFLSFALSLALLFTPGCSSSRSDAEESYEYEENDGHLHTYNHNLKTDEYICSECGKVYEGDPDNLVEEEDYAEQDSGSQSAQGASRRSGRSTSPAYEDERWPTTRSDLLSIPESDRWYNASGKIGTYCTVAGPVKSVYCASDSPGKPVFVSIGSAYPSQDCVELVVWTEGDWSAFSRMLTDVDSEPNSWLSVTGWLQLYDGYMQINSADGCEFSWWTNVN